jgi:ABC-2 type transport system ATP-binding protein
LASILEISNLSKGYDDFLLDHVSLCLDEGFIMGLIGPNGAGKTTIIKLILNLISKDSGSIRIFGSEMQKNEIDLKQRIGFVMDDSGWYESFTIKEMTKIISPFYKEWNNNIFNDYLGHFELKPEYRIEHLSKGMKMKFSLAVALSHNAQLIIMDEPTSGLDPVIRTEVLEILQQLIAEENKSILFSSHISSDVEKIADYITFINNGKIVFTESKEDIAERFSLVKGPLDLLDRDTASCFDAVKKQKSHFTALCTRTQELDYGFGKYISSGKMTVEKAGIDDIMFLTVKGENYVKPGL